MGQGIGEVLWGVDPNPVAPAFPAAPGGTPVGNGTTGRSS
ncbi:MAG: hypothetical protein K0T00_1946 [Gaiellaceae bacterium]|nr:hypothetical protein [Gaiellaceae bacterium]